MLKPYIKEWAYVPLETLGTRLQATMNRLTVHPRMYGPGEPTTIPVYSTQVPGYLGMPIDWALTNFPLLQFEDRTVQGAECYYHRLPDPQHPRAAPGQDVFMADFEREALDYFTLMVKAATGSGKTVVSLSTAAKLGRRTLILVHLENLAMQWRDEIHTHLGIPMEDIGWVQGDVCDFEHPFVIGVLQSVAKRPYPRAFYDSIGTVIFDEGHRLGAPTFSQAMGLFGATNKWIQTATDKRADGCEKVFHYHFGQPRVVAKQPALRTRVHSIPYDCRLPHWAKMPGVIASKLGDDENRNAMLVRLIGKLYANDRQTLIIGDRVQHLQHLITLCISRGIPADRIGLFVDQRYTGQSRLRFSKAKTVTRGDRLVYWKPPEGDEPVFNEQERIRVVTDLGAGHFRATREDEWPRGPWFDVHVEDVRKLPVAVPSMVKVPKEELDRVKRSSQLIFATYGMLREGIDIARLDAGLDVTPQASAEQVIGRIRRWLPEMNKPMPIWYTIHDRGHPTTERSWQKRMREYRASNCEVVEHHVPI